MIFAIALCSVGSLVLQRHMSNLFARELPSYIVSKDLNRAKNHFMLRTTPMKFANDSLNSSKELTEANVHTKFSPQTNPHEAGVKKDSVTTFEGSFNATEFFKDSLPSFQTSSNLPKWMKGMSMLFFI